jgi:hypothetical protein
MTRHFAHNSSVAMVFVLGMTLLLAGCGKTISDQEKAQLAKHPDCVDADEDIAVLEKQRASTMKQIGLGAQYVVPVAAAVNAFRSYNQDGTSEEFYNDREQVLTGEYNKSIDAKIEEIQRTCGLPGA